MVVKPLDLEFVRRQFPALGGSFAFFDNAGGSQVLGRVVDRIADYLLHSNVQLGASYSVSRHASERLAEATQAVAGMLNAAESAEIAFGASSTQLLANLALALAVTLREGDEIVVSEADHEANIGPWRRLAERGVRLRPWHARPETWQLEPEDLRALLTERTRLVCFTHTSNILGAITPVAELTRIAHEAGAQVCVDGVAYAAHRAVDVRAWDVDYYAFSWYKVFGPHHAVLYARRAAVEALGNLNHEFLGPDIGLYKLQPGKYNFELTYGLTGIVDYLQQLGRMVSEEPAGTVRGRILQAFEAVADHEEALGKPLLDWIRSRPRVRLIGPATASRDLRVPTFSFAVEGRRSSAIPPLLDHHDIGVRWGHFYSKRLIDRLGLAEGDGVVRVSMVHYNTHAEVERLLRHLDEAVDG